MSHEDSLGNQGALGSGDVQWMAAGKGILHQEMPQGDPKGRMHGFQLWANLPSTLKMTMPRYQDVASRDIPEIVDDDGTRVRVVCGSFWGKRGPVDGIAADPSYLDVWVPSGRRKTLPVDTRRNAFAYVFEGSGDFRHASAPRDEHEGTDPTGDRRAARGNVHRPGVMIVGASALPRSDERTASIRSGTRRRRQGSRRPRTPPGA